MKKNNTVGEAAIGEHCTQAIDEHFETLRPFVVGDGHVVEIYPHGSPFGPAGIAVRAGFFGFPHEDLRLTGKVYQRIAKNYGVGESEGSLLKRRASSA